MTGLRDPGGVKHRVEPWVSGLPGTHTVIDLGNALTLAVDELPASRPHAAVGGGDLPAIIFLFASLVEDQLEAHATLAEEQAGSLQLGDEKVGDVIVILWEID